MLSSVESVVIWHAPFCSQPLLNLWSTSANDQVCIQSVHCVETACMICLLCHSQFVMWSVPVWCIFCHCQCLFCLEKERYHLQITVHHNQFLSVFVLEVFLLKPFIRIALRSKQTSVTMYIETVKISKAIPVT
jgi:hypothetical protein